MANKGKPKTTIELFESVRQVDTGGYVTHDAIKDAIWHLDDGDHDGWTEEPHRDLAMAVASEETSEFNRHIEFFRRALGLTGDLSPEKARDYLQKRKDIEDAFETLGKYDIIVYCDEEDPRIGYAIREVRGHEVGFGKKLTAPEILIERLKLGDLALPENLADVLETSFIRKAPPKFNEGGVNQAEADLLNALGATSGSTYPARFPAREFPTGIFRTSDEYETFIQGLYDLAKEE